jgi:hypothetical protein
VLTFLVSSSILFLKGIPNMTRTLYKLTDENLTTQNNTLWVINEWKETDGIQQSLCNSSWLHAYEDPYVAAFMYVIHVYYSNPRFFKAEGNGKFLSDGTKCGVTKLRLLEEIPLPTITTEQRVKIAILCALEVCHEASFVTWANNWLSGKDRSEDAAAAYADAAYNAARAAAFAADYADAAYNAARAAAWAADYAACAACAACADYAARAAADTAYNATYAAAQALQSKSFDLSAIIQKVLKEG